MNPRTKIALLSLSILCLSAAFAFAQCPELITQEGDNWRTPVGIVHDGDRWAAGQLMPLACDYRFEMISFLVNWGTSHGDSPSVVTGDTLFCAILKEDYSHIATTHALIPDGVSGSVYLDFDFTAQDVLLPADTYFVICYTNVDAYSALSYCSSCEHEGTYWLNTDGINPDTWELDPFDGDMAYILVLDSDVTPVDTVTWDGVKSFYR